MFPWIVLALGLILTVLFPPVGIIFLFVFLAGLGRFMKETKNL